MTKKFIAHFLSLEKIICLHFFDNETINAR